MKAIIATFGEAKAVSHLWLVEGWVRPSQLVDSLPPIHGFLTDVGDTRPADAICGKYRRKAARIRIRKSYNWSLDIYITIAWLYTKEGEVCKRCQAIAKRKGLGMGYYLTEGRFGVAVEGWIPASQIG
jgi:hypothetical protein